MSKRLDQNLAQRRVGPAAAARVQVAHQEDGDAQEEGQEAAVHERHNVSHLRHLRSSGGCALKRQHRGRTGAMRLHAAPGA